eukprot:3724728-Rhodomonas_salina.1
MIRFRLWRSTLSAETVTVGDGMVHPSAWLAVGALTLGIDQAFPLALIRHLDATVKLQSAHAGRHAPPGSSSMHTLHSSSYIMIDTTSVVSSLASAPA